MNYALITILKAKKMIQENPRICDICGSKETFDNIILKYDNGKYMCDDCSFKFYDEDEEL